MPKRAPARCDAPSVTRSPRSNMLGLTVNPRAKLTSPMTPPEQALLSSPTPRAGLIVASPAMVSVRLAALPIRPPLAVLPLTLKPERSMLLLMATVAPLPQTPTRPPALAPSLVVWIVGSPLEVPGSVSFSTERDAASARVFTSRPALSVFDWILMARVPLPFAV